MVKKASQLHALFIFCCLASVVTTIIPLSLYFLSVTILDSVFREKDISLQLFGSEFYTLFEFMILFRSVDWYVAEFNVFFPITCLLFTEAETLEAIAQFDFTARSQRELSFKKGDLLTLYTQVSSDWWKGTKDGRDGLVPDKYIMLRIRDEDRERLEVGKLSTTSGSTSSSSEESAAAARRRTSSSSETSASSARLSKIRQDSRPVTASESIESESPVPSLPSPRYMSSRQHKNICNSNSLFLFW